MSFGRTKSRSDTDSTKAVSGTIRNMPIVPQQWFDMYGGAASSLGMGGNRTPFDPTPGGTFAPPPPGTTPQQGQVPNQPFGIDGQQFPQQSQAPAAPAAPAASAQPPVSPEPRADFGGMQFGGQREFGLTRPQQRGLDTLQDLVRYNPAQAGISGAQADISGAQAGLGEAQRGFGTAQQQLENTAQGFGIARGDVRGAGRMAQQALGGAGQQIGDIASDYTRAYADRGSNTLGAFFPDAPDIDAAQVGGVGGVGARQGSQVMSAYQNPFEQDVVQATLSDAENALNRRLNIAKMGAAAGGALGGGRQQVGERSAIEQYGKGLAGQLGALRSQGFQQAAGLGQTDASRFLQADLANQGVGLSRAQQQAGLDQQAMLQRAAMEDERQRFDIGQADIGDQRRMQAIRDMVSQRQLSGQMGAAGAQAFGQAAAQGAQLGGQQGEAALAAARAGGEGAQLGAQGAGLGVNAANLGLLGSQLTTQDAMNLINAGAIGPEQAAVLMGIGTATFGDEEDRDLTTTGRSSVRGSTTSFGL